MPEAEPTTAELVGPLLVYGVAAWIGVAVLETAATASFVAQLGAIHIPAVNLVGAALAAGLGLGYARLHHTGRDGTRWLNAVVIVVTGVAAGLALGLRIETSAALVFGGLVLYRLAKIVMPLALWDAAGERLDLSQGRRLFGLIGATQPIGRVAAYAAVPLLVPLIGTTGLFAVSAMALVVASVSLRWARRPAGGLPPPAVAPVPAVASGVTAPRPPVRELLRGRMVPAMLLLAAATTACYTILSFSFSLAGGQRFTSADSLATAVALVSAASALLAALASAVAARGVLRRFGVPGAIALRGLAVAAAGVLVAVVAGPTAGATTVFVAVAGLRIVEDVTSSLAEPATRLLGRVLPPARRAVVNAAIDAVVAPAALAVASLVIIVLVATHSDTFTVLGVLVAAVAAGGAATAWSVSRDYRDVLREALAEGAIDLTATDLDPETVRELDRVLATGSAPAVAYALDLLAEAEPDAYAERLAATVGHPDEQVRLDVLARVERLDLVALVPAIQARLRAEGAPRVRGASARVVAALSDPDRLDGVLPYLSARDPAIRRGAMAGLLRSGEIEAILAAGEPLLELVRSSDPARRGEAAAVLGEGGLSGLYRPLRTLLADPDPTVVEAALRAAPAVRHAGVWPAVIDQLARPGVRPMAQRALERGGEAALPAVAAALAPPLFDAPTDGSTEVAIGLLSSTARMGPAAVPVLEAVLAPALASPDRRVGDATVAALLALDRGGFGGDPGPVEADLERGLAVCARLVVDEDDLTSGRAATPLVVAVAAHLRARRARVVAGLLDRWALLQEPEIAGRVIAVLSAGRRRTAPAEDRSYAIESLETGPHRGAGRLIAAAVTTPDPAALRLVLAPRVAHELSDQPVLDRLLATAGHHDPVLAGLALQLAADLGPRQLGAALETAAPLEHPFVVTTRRLLADRLHAARERSERPHADRPVPSPEETPMMTPVERMLALKSSDLLAEADDDLLVEILDQVTDRQVAEGDVLFLEGEPPTRLFLVLSGSIELERAGSATRRLGPGDLAGELAVLDASPYASTAVVRQAGAVIDLPSDVVELLMAAEPTFSRQLLRRLARRARLAETGHGAVADDAMASILDRLVEGEGR